MRSAEFQSCSRIENQLKNYLVNQLKNEIPKNVAVLCSACRCINSYLATQIIDFMSSP